MVHMINELYINKDAKYHSQEQLCFYDYVKKNAKIPGPKCKWIVTALWKMKIKAANWEKIFAMYLSMEEISRWKLQRTLRTQ